MRVSRMSWECWESQTASRLSTASSTLSRRTEDGIRSLKLTTIPSRIKGSDKKKSIEATAGLNEVATDSLQDEPNKGCTRNLREASKRETTSKEINRVNCMLCLTFDASILAHKPPSYEYDQHFLCALYPLL
jgi:hypothetical protein